jgi:MFS family permease
MQVQFGGILLGTIFIAPLSDRFGRKPIGLSAFALAILALAASALARNAPQLLLARFMLCFLIGGAKVVLAAFTMEIIPPDCRIYLRTFCNWVIFWENKNTLKIIYNI